MMIIIFNILISFFVCLKGALPSEPVKCHARKQLKMDYVVSAGHTHKQKSQTTIGTPLTFL